jgi:acyl-CoA-binding protein
MRKHRPAPQRSAVPAPKRSAACGAPHAQPPPHTRHRCRRTGAGAAWLMGLLLPLMCSITEQAERREVLRMRGGGGVALAGFTPGGWLYQGRHLRLAALRAVEPHQTAMLLCLRGGSARAGVSPGEGIAGGEADTHLTREFLAAAEFARKMPGLPAEDKLVFYGLYKQATVGPCNTSKPSCFAWADIAKWQRWQALKVCMRG